MRFSRTPWAFPVPFSRESLRGLEKIDLRGGQGGFCVLMRQKSCVHTDSIKVKKITYQKCRSHRYIRNCKTGWLTQTTSPDNLLLKWSCQISPADSAEILNHIVWRTWLSIADSDERWLCYQISLRLSTHPSETKFGGVKTSSKTQGQIVGWRGNWGERRNDDGEEKELFPSFPFLSAPSPSPSAVVSSSAPVSPPRSAPGSKDGVETEHATRTFARRVHDNSLTKQIHQLCKNTKHEHNVRVHIINFPANRNLNTRVFIGGNDRLRHKAGQSGRTPTSLLTLLCRPGKGEGSLERGETGERTTCSSPPSPSSHRGCTGHQIQNNTSAALWLP